MTTINLQPTVDQDALLAQFQNILSAQQVWTAVSQSSTGIQLSSMIAGYAALDLYQIEQAARERYTETSLRDSSAYAIANTLGVYVNRKRPASMQVSLTQTVTLTAFSLPAQTSFVCGAYTLFNREAINWPQNTSTITITLYEGSPQSYNVNGGLLDFQAWLSPHANYVVSDSDVIVNVNGSPIKVVTDILSNYPNTSAVRSRTTRNGNMQLVFGTTSYGYRPGPSDSINIMYAVTQGLNGNNTAISGLPVSCTANSNVSGTALTGLTNGQNELSPALLRQIGPLNFTSRNGASTPAQLNALCVTYPGVIDAYAVPQRQYAPMDPKFNSWTRIGLITTSVWTTDQQNAFLNWLSTKPTNLGQFYLYPVATLPVAISLNAYITGGVSVTAAQTAITTAIQNLFVEGFGTIGHNIYKDDILNAARSSFTGIDYLELVTPTSDILCTVQSPSDVQLINGASSAMTGTFLYSVTSVVGTTETLATNFQQITVAGNSVQIGWTAVSGALSYNVYRRDSAGNNVLLGNTVSNTFTDNNDVGTPVTAPSATGPLIYPVLASLVVNVLGSNRRKLT